MKRLAYAMAGGANGSFIGPIHRMAVRMDDLADLVAGSFSRDAEKNRETGESLRLDPARVYPSWREMIDAEKGKVDFISVCTCNDSHFEIAMAALEAGMDVVCEKPLALDAASADALAAAAKKAGRFVAVPFTYSGFPMVKLARDLVSSGELGRICKIVLEYVQGSFRKIDFTKPLDRRNAWKMDPVISGPSCALADIGVHAFHLIEYTSGLSVGKVLADVSSFAPGNTLEDDASVLMRMLPAPGGGPAAKAALVVSKIATGEENGVRLRIYGDKASLFWNQEAPNYLSVKSPFAPERIYKRKAPYMADVSPASVASSRIPAGHHEGFIEGFANIYREFCAAVIDRKPHDFPGADEGARSMRFVDACLDSAANGSTWRGLDGE